MLKQSISSYGLSHTYVNGDKVSDISYDAEYDGKHANISAKSGNERVYMKLNNKDLMRLLNVKTDSTKSLHEKLIDDFTHKAHQKRIHSKQRHSKQRHSKQRHSKQRHSTRKIMNKYNCRTKRRLRRLKNKIK